MAKRSHLKPRSDSRLPETVIWRILKNADRDPYEAKNEELSNEKVRMAISYIRKGS